MPAVFKTINGGVTWTRERLPRATPELAGMHFVDANDGWAVGTAYNDTTGAETGWVLHTTDGGLTWTRVPDTSAILGYSVIFTDALHGWIGGDSGVYATTDGGVTWKPVSSAYGVTSVAAADAKHVWAGGMGFMVSTVDGAGDTAAPATVERRRRRQLYARTAVSLHLLSDDIGGAGLAGLQYKIDDDAWRDGEAVQVQAPANHANDGEHILYFRATDNAGNREATQARDVIIDTLGPACAAPRRMEVDAGGSGILYFYAADATSGVRRIELTLRDTPRACGAALHRALERLASSGRLRATTG